MTITKNSEGAYVISETTANGDYLVTRRYYGYNKREAVARFRRELKEINLVAR